MPVQDGRGYLLTLRRVGGLPVLGALLCTVLGCTRHYYRNFADRDVYRVENERMTDPRWAVPPRPVEADPRSRIATIHDPDHMPIPPDDPAARAFQVSNGRPFEFHGWDKRGGAPVEDLRWLDCVPRGPDGKIVLDAASAMRVALMNSRIYQSQVEQVYLQALGLTFSRFSFFPQGIANGTTQYRHFGSGKTASDQLQLFSQNAVNWSFYSGANLLVNLANGVFFEYDGKGFQTAISGLSINLTQPLLRGAFARNVTQPLSLAERQTLYTVRDFASFRRTFYVNVVSGYLQLLSQLQSIHNFESQIEELKRNVVEYDALERAGLLNPIDRDNLAQTELNTRQNLLGAEAQYQTSLDNYRVQVLGLPADFPVTIDESILNRFELNDRRLDSLRRSNDALYLGLLQYDVDKPPAASVIVDAARSLLDEYRTLAGVSELVGTEMTKWDRQIEGDRARVDAGVGPIGEDDRVSFRRQLKLAAELRTAYEDTKLLLEDNIQTTSDLIDSAPTADPKEVLRKLRDFVGRDLRARLSELFVIETQVRVYLIELNPVNMEVDQAVSVALANRLDLMNSLARVTDSWRNVEVAGNSLMAGLSAVYQGNLNPSPAHGDFLRFDASNSLHTVGLRFDAPIVRRAERNAYRADQILFQQARRAYMLNHDTVVQNIRLDMRNLNLNRRQFDVGREQLLVAARQVDQTEYNARASTGGATGGGQIAGLQLQNALTQLLGAKNGLISNWVQYEVQRMGLYRDFDLMSIDAQGVWTNDSALANLNGGPAPAVIDPLRAPDQRLYPGPSGTPDDAPAPSEPAAPPPPPPAPGAPGPFKPA